MALKDLISDKTINNPNTLSLSRSVALMTFVVLSFGFGVSAWKNPIGWEIYIAYPMGVTIAFAPQLFLRFLDGIRGMTGMLKEVK